MTYSSPKNALRRNLAREFFYFSECTSVWEFLDARENQSGLKCELPHSFLSSTGLFSVSVPFPQLKCIWILIPGVIHAK